MFDLYTTVTLMTLFFLAITIVDVSTNRLITKTTKTKAIITCLLIAVSALGECVGVLSNKVPRCLIQSDILVAV